MENESPEKLRGSYYTPDDIAAFLARWVAEISPKSLLEPSVGDGAFLRALVRHGGPSMRRVCAFEIDATEAEKARSAARLLQGVESAVHADDFLSWATDRADASPPFDAVVGNPPFIRYQYMTAHLQGRAEKIIRSHGLPFTKHTNAWVPFIVASLAMIRPGGRLAMVVPAELLHVLHAQSVRTFLLEQCSRVIVLDPDEIWFEGTLQGVVLLLAQKREAGPSRGLAQVGIKKVRGREFLGASPDQLLSTSDYTDGAVLPAKWMLALLNDRERSLLTALDGNEHVTTFRRVAKVAVGIVTGANKFFLVPDAVVHEFGLHEFARPMFGRSEHVPGVVYDEAVHVANRDAGLPTNFIWFNGTPRDKLPDGALRYVQIGEAEGLHTRYKCRIRDPWFTVPSVFTAPVGMLKRSHDYPRLVLNELGAYTTDTAYRIQPAAVSAERLVYSFVNSLTALSAELEGRHYGGGVLELVPSEINRLLLPRTGDGAHGLAELDAAYRRNAGPEAIFEMQDKELLGRVGFSAGDIGSLRQAWYTLRNRRQRARPHDNEAVMPIAEHDDPPDVAMTAL